MPNWFSTGHKLLSALTVRNSRLMPFFADEDQEPVPNKKKRGAALDPSEVAIRKEESARKRRNVSEKKLQNEKVPSAPFPPRISK